MKVLPFIPYFETTRYRVTAMVELSGIKPGEKVADLGSGDGRISIEFAKLGAIVTGYELNPKLAEVSRQLILDQKLNDQITILEQDFWDTDLSGFDVIAVYPMPDIMRHLEEKLKKELKPGVRVVTNYYQFPNWKYTQVKDHVYLYER